MKYLIFSLVIWSFFSPASTYDLVRDYSGQNFFSGWDFFGNYDNLTDGDVWWLDQANATSQHLAYVDSTTGNAILKVDNTTNVPYGDKRNSVRITTQDFFPIGSLWIIDALHIPFGCSVWPAFWSSGTNWPVHGEIDIIEAVNNANNNQYAIHTTAGCTKTTPQDQTGWTGPTDCSQGSGCVVGENKANSYAQGFANVGGGVFATQLDASGVYMWFWSRSDIPASITGSTSSIDISTWGPPSAAFPNSSCSIGEYFAEQQLILDITLCGDWAGVPAIYQSSCGANGVCYNDNVMGNGSNYDDAYFEISYIRAYTTGTATVSGPVPSSTASTSSSGSTGSPSPSSNASAASMGHSWFAGWTAFMMFSVFLWAT